MGKTLESYYYSFCGENCLYRRKRRFGFLYHKVVEQITAAGRTAINGKLLESRENM